MGKRCLTTNRERSRAIIACLKKEITDGEEVMLRYQAWRDIVNIPTAWNNHRNFAIFATMVLGYERFEDFVMLIEPSDLIMTNGLARALTYK